MVAKLLLARGADPNSESGYLGTAFMAAYCMGHTKIVDLLRAAGADPYPSPALFRNIWCASELRSLIRNVIVGSSGGSLDVVDQQILGKAAAQFLEMGQTSSSEEIGVRLLKQFEITHGRDYSQTLRWCRFLARVFDLQKRYQEAEAMARRAQHGREKVRGPKHPMTLKGRASRSWMIGVNKNVKGS